MTTQSTSVSDVLAHVRELIVKAKGEYHERAGHAMELAFTDPNYRHNELEQQRAYGEWLSLSRVAGYLEARIQIDEIWVGQTTRQILDPLAK